MVAKLLRPVLRVQSLSEGPLAGPLHGERERKAEVRKEPGVGLTSGLQQKERLALPGWAGSRPPTAVPGPDPTASVSPGPP